MRLPARRALPNLRLVRSRRRQLIRGSSRHRGKRTLEELARALVIGEMLGEGLADALCHPPMDLACERQLVDDGATSSATT